MHAMTKSVNAGQSTLRAYNSVLTIVLKQSFRLIVIFPAAPVSGNFDIGSKSYDFYSYRGSKICFSPGIIGSLFWVAGSVTFTIGKNRRWCQLKNCSCVGPGPKFQIPEYLDKNKIFGEYSITECKLQENCLIFLDLGIFHIFCMQNFRKVST